MLLSLFLPGDGDDHDAHGVLAHVVEDPAVEEEVEDERVDDDNEVEEGEGEATRRTRVGSPVCDAPIGSNHALQGGRIGSRVVPRLRELAARRRDSHPHVTACKLAEVRPRESCRARRRPRRGR